MAVDAARAKSLFLTASDLADPAERAAFLDRECGGDAELRARVEALLRADDPGLLGLPVAQEAAVDFAVGQPQTEDYGDPTARVGAVLACKYKLVEAIGEGGMGSVFLAQQTDPVKRAVAIKVIKAGMDSKAVLARFEAERQALAMMDHPNIARVLDAGTTEGGRPYFVMELVKGLPITRFCDERKLTPRQRLELFVPVCQAIQHAHQKGIIHRDIKPSNVLIALYDDKPVPKVIDFGVSKATGTALTDLSLMTGFNAVVGTPEYMSPEQASLNNLDIDTRSDVYSLGVLLYELLTGATPVDRKSLGKAAVMEILRIVREVEAPRPSAKLSTIDTLASVAANRGMEPAKLSKLMKGELDWLVLRALEKDRARRYATANGLAADVLRYLSGEPVLAHPPSTAYRLKKFIWRNKGPVIAAAAVALAMVGGVAAVMIVQAKANRDLTAANQQLAAANEREREANAKTAARFNLAMDAIGTFHSGVSEDLLLKQKEFETLRKTLLGGAADFYRKLQAQHGGDPDPQSRAALARAYAGLGEMGSKVGATDQAFRDFAEGRALYAALIAEKPDDPAPGRELIQLLNETAYLYEAQKKPADWRRAAAQAVAEGERLVALDPNVAEHQSLLAKALIVLGQASRDAPAEQEQIYGRAIAILEPLAAAHPQTADYRRFLASAIASLAVVAYHRGRYEENVRLNARAAEICETIRHADPANLKNRRSLAVICESGGLALGRLGRFEEALAQFRRAQQVLEELTNEQPAVMEFQTMLANEHQNSAWALWQIGRRDESLESCRKQLAVLDTLVARHPDRPGLKFSLALSALNTGISLSDLGKTDEALAHYRRAVQIEEELVKSHPAEQDYGDVLAKCWTRLGWLYRSTGRMAEATAAYRQARDIAESLAKDHPANPQIRALLASSWHNFGFHVGSSGRPAEGLAALARARELAERLAADLPSNPEHRTMVGGVLTDIALVCQGAGDEAGGLAAGERALAIREQLVTDFPKSTDYRARLAATLSQIGLIYQRAGRLAEARAALGRCREIWEQLAAEVPKQVSFHDEVGRALANLGYLETQAGEPANALALHLKAVAIREQVVIDDPKNKDYQRGLGYSLTYLGQAYRRLGKRAEAGQALERALGLVEPLMKTGTQIAPVQALQLETRLELGMLRLAEGRTQDAAEHFARALQAAADRPEPSVEEIVLLAAVHAQSSRLPEPLGAAADPGGATSHADRAMAQLNRAVAKGFGDAMLLTRSDAYDPLRDRGDFGALVKRLKEKGKSGSQGR
jgi:serine/threonine protein kinase/tetratricopeptide (TPR) repeat protein